MPRSFGESRLELRGSLGLLSGVGSPFCHRAHRSMAGGLRSGHHLTPTVPVRAPPPPTLLLTRSATGRHCRAPAACSQLRVPGGTTPSKDTALRLPLPAWPAWVAALEPDSFTSP